MKIYNRYKGNKKTKKYANRLLKIAQKYARYNKIYKKKCESSKRKSIRRSQIKRTNKTKRKIRNSARNCIMANKYYAQYIKYKALFNRYKRSRKLRHLAPRFRKGAERKLRLYRIYKRRCAGKVSKSRSRRSRSSRSRSISRSISRIRRLARSRISRSRRSRSRRSRRSRGSRSRRSRRYTKIAKRYAESAKRYALLARKPRNKIYKKNYLKRAKRARYNAIRFTRLSKR